MFTAALLTQPKTWKQLKCPSTDDQIKMWSIHIMDYYSGIKDEILPFVTTWMNLENIMLGEVRKI